MIFFHKEIYIFIFAQKYESKYTTRDQNNLVEYRISFVWENKQVKVRLSLLKLNESGNYNYWVSLNENVINACAFL